MALAFQSFFVLALLLVIPASGVAASDVASSGDPTTDIWISIAVQIPVVIAFIYFGLKLNDRYMTFVDKSTDKFTAEMAKRDQGLKQIMDEAHKNSEASQKAQMTAIETFLTNERSCSERMIGDLSDNIRDNTEEVRVQGELLRSHMRIPTDEEVVKSGSTRKKRGN